MYRTLTVLGVAVLLLLAIGFVVLASASQGSGFRLYGNQNFFVVRQGIGLAVAVFCMIPAVFFDYHKWRTMPGLTIAAYLVVVALMAVVLALPATKGSHRWISLGPIHLQPSEFAKLMAVFATAVFLDRVGLRIELFWKGACCAAAIVGLLVGLAIVEPDFGAAMVIGGAGAVLFVVSGMKLVHMALLGLLGVGAAGTLLLTNANRMHRMAGWLPEGLARLVGITPEMVASSLDKGSSYQFDMAQVAIVGGGVAGKGLFKSEQSLGFLPEMHTDCIFAIGAEELGLAFSLGLLALYVTIFVLGMVIAYRAEDRLGRLLAMGMTFLIVFQALFNMGVVSGIFPPKGMALPFISYGGTNLIATLIAVGTLFNVGRQIGLPKARPRSTISSVFSQQGEN